MEAIDILRRNITNLRIKARLSSYELATMCGISKPYVWQLETGRATNPSFEIINSIAKALNVSPAFLLTEDRQMPTHDLSYITNKYLSLDEENRLKMHKMIDVLFN